MLSRTSTAFSGETAWLRSASATSMPSRIIATVCCRVMTPANDRGALPKTSTVSGCAGRSGLRYQVTKLPKPAWSTIPIQARCSADSSPNQGISRSIRAREVLVRSPTARCSWRAICARERGLVMRSPYEPDEPPLVRASRPACRAARPCTRGGSAEGGSGVPALLLDPADGGRVVDAVLVKGLLGQLPLDLALLGQ